MNKAQLHKIATWYRTGKATALQGRWIPFSRIEPLLKKLKSPFQVVKIGTSVNKVPIYKVVIGTGPLNILIWSQMHGNESTGTKAVFDFFNLCSHPSGLQPVVQQLLERCTITVIPMLNPDGAAAYTRVNATSIDLNRDAVDLKAPESAALRTTLDTIQPNYCFNLHDQRTIFTVGDTKKPATLSFLAPSTSIARTVTAGRKETMRVIVAMNQVVQQLIPGQVGRYTDEFYPKATGDNFQKEGYNTVLIEAGHAKDDYDREEVRYYNFLALLSGLLFIADGKEISHKPYFEIPNNSKFYLDILYQQIFVENENRRVDVGVLFKEQLEKSKITFNPEIEIVGDLKSYNANEIINKKGVKVLNRADLKEIIKN